MKTKPIDRRQFIQVAALAATGTASAVVLVRHADSREGDRVGDRSHDRGLEHWLLDTGRHSLDEHIYSITSKQL